MELYLVQTIYEGGPFHEYFVLYHPETNMWLMDTAYSGGHIEEVGDFVPGFTFDDHWEEIVTKVGDI